LQFREEKAIRDMRTLARILKQIAAGHQETVAEEIVRGFEQRKEWS